MNVKRVRGLAWADMISYIALTIYGVGSEEESMATIKDKYLNGVSKMSEVANTLGNEFLLSVKMGTFTKMTVMLGFINPPVW